MTPHLLRSFLVLSVFAALPACGGDARGGAALAGHWSEETGTDRKGMTIEFDPETDKLLVHTAPDEHGGHDHLSGTYTFDATGGTVTVRCELAGKGKGDVWSGKVAGDHLTLTSQAMSLKFHQGKNPHEHK